MTGSVSSIFNSSDADLVLRSCSPDPMDFHVHRCILSAASPFFREMFSLPQAPLIEGESPSIPIVDVSETGSTLDKLLQLVYPMADPRIESLDELSAILDVAMKYDLTIVVETLRRILVTPRFVVPWPTRVYAIACRYDLEEEAKVASRYTLTVNVLDCPLSEDLKHITAYAYHRLLDLHRSRAKAAQELLHRTVPDSNVKCMLCNGAPYAATLAPKWWHRFQEMATEELSLRPTTDVVFSMAFLAKVAVAGCDRCPGSILSSYAFLEDLRKKMDDLPATI